MTVDKKIPLVEVFGPTIQGEGHVIGQQTYFLRFGLCDYKCTMCDSMHAVDPREVKTHAKFLTQEEIAEELFQINKANTTNWVTFSGGNPCIHDLSELVDILHKRGWKIAVETQGTLVPEWIKRVDVVTISPKGPGIGEQTDLEVLDRFMEKSTDFPHYEIGIGVERVMKIVVFDERDLEFAAAMYERYADQLDGFCLSQGNPNPPNKEGKSDVPRATLLLSLLDGYRRLFEDICNHPVLHKVKFLPQWHVFVWGQDKGH